MPRHTLGGIERIDDAQMLAIAKQELPVLSDAIAMSIIVATTTAPHKIDGSELSWLTWIERFRAQAGTRGHDLRVFAALELDARGLAPFERLIGAIKSALGEYWTYHFDDGATRIDSGNRLARICEGRNMCIEYAQRNRPGDFLLYLDTDVIPDGDTIDKLLAVTDLGYRQVGGEVPSYVLGGERVTGVELPLVERSYNTAGYLMVHRDVYRRLRWRWDWDAGLTDDPCWFADARDFLGVPCVVRVDCVGRHQPEVLVPIEHRGMDLAVWR